MIKLQNSGILISTEGLRLAKRTSTTSMGLVTYYIHLEYKDGVSVKVRYSQADYGDHADMFRDKDFNQIGKVVRT
jgi:hypothetical protein